jgi:hypothetical protein
LFPSAEAKSRELLNNMPNLQLTKREALARTTEIKREVGAAKRSRIRILRLIAASVDRREYEIAGFESLEAWLGHVGIETSVSHFLRLLHNVRALRNVSATQLEAIPEGSAHLLARLPEKLRTNALIEKAASQKPSEFRVTVAEVRGKKLGEREPEKWATYERKLPRGVYDALLAAEEKIARVLELDIAEESDKRATNLITVLESIASLINQTDESRLLVETEGE